MNKNRSSKKSVFLLLPNLNGGGAERVILDLAVYFESLDDPYEVTLVVFSATGAYAAHVPKNISMVDLEASRTRYAAWRLWRLLWQGRPDIVLSSMQASSLFFLVRLFLYKKSYWICRMENPYSYDIVSMKYLAKVFYTLSLLHANVVVCLNNGMREDLHKHTSVCKDRIVVIPNPINIDQVKNASLENIILQHPAIVMCGRLVSQKRYDIALRALALIHETHPDVHLYVLGEGPLQGDLCDLANKLNIDTKVHFMGFKDNPHAWMSAADIFLITSEYEGFGNVIVEALVAGTPVVSTDCPTGPNSILEQTSYLSLVPVGDFNAIAKTVRNIIDWTSSERDKNILLFTQYVERYKLPIVGGQYIRIFDNYEQH